MFTKKPTGALAENYIRAREEIGDGFGKNLSGPNRLYQIGGRGA
jgi:hypothetical protein